MGRVMVFSFWIFLLLTLGNDESTAFAPSSSNHHVSAASPSKTQVRVEPLVKTTEEEESLNITSPLSLNLPSSSNNSWGSVLLQLQKEEQEEMRKIIGTNEPSSSSSSSSSSSFVLDLEETHRTFPPLPRESDSLSPMDLETAQELDNSVTYVPRQRILEDLRVLELPLKLQQEHRSSSSSSSPPEEAEQMASTFLQDMPLSRPEHHRDRIGRDMRLVATSVAGSVEDESQWRLFCAENGGVKQLLRCVEDGARFMEDFRRQDEEEFSMVASQYQQSFLAACSACRALRDLCALSPDMASVVTDEVLRANHAWNGQLLKDIATLLRHAEDAEILFSRMYVKRRRVSIDIISPRDIFRLEGRRNRRESRRRCKLYVLQLLLAMVVASDDAVDVLRATPGLKEAIVGSSSYARKEKVRSWLRPQGLLRRFNRRSAMESNFRSLDELTQQVQGTANQVLAALGHNMWVPKMPGQKGLRVLCLDGGGTRGVVAIAAMRALVEKMGGAEVCDSFDIIAGTSTGAIIAFLVGVRRETSKQASERYDTLVKKIFVKSALSTPMMMFTTAGYDDGPFMDVLRGILKDATMLDSRYDPSVPLVFGVTSIMSSTPTHVLLYRNYNYAGGEMPDNFTIDPEQARRDLGLEPEFEESAPKSDRHELYQKPWIVGEQLRNDGSRHPGSFRTLQRYALRSSAAAPTFFKPVQMGGATFADGGVVASNPTAVAVHEAKVLFPDVPIELLVSIGTGAASEEKVSPTVGWNGIIAQIVNSALDAERTHQTLEDVWGENGLARASPDSTRYYRFNPLLGGPNDFPIDTTDPEILDELTRLTERYLEEPDQQKKINEIVELVNRKPQWFT